MTDYINAKENSLEQRVNDTKMIFILSLAVGYCFSLTVVCGHFAFNS